MRKDPPFDNEFVYSTYLLEQAERAGALVVNRPQSLRDCNEKFFATQFTQCTPPTMVSRRSDILREFAAEHRDIILKPLDGMGGSSIFRHREGDPNLSVILETLTQHGSQQIMAQRYLLVGVRLPRQPLRGWRRVRESAQVIVDGVDPRQLETPPVHLGHLGPIFPWRQQQEEQRTLYRRGEAPAVGNNLAQILSDGKVQPRELAIARFAANRYVFLYDHPMKLGQTLSVQPYAWIKAL